MKQIIFLVAITSALIAGNNYSYMGFDIGNANNCHTASISGYSINGDNDYNKVRIKFGSGEDGGTKFQIAFNKIDFNSGIYDNTNNSLYEIGLDFIKEFEATPLVFPFIKTGISMGRMNTDFTADGNVREMSLNIGAGLSYKATDKIYMLIGIDQVWRKWSDVFVGPGTLEIKDRALNAYVGINYNF